jgi:MFS transporter, LAT3 family, solute carrier family 43, member 3
MLSSLTWSANMDALKDCKTRLWSTSQRFQSVAHFIFAFLTISLASGTVYGWPALRRHLVQNEKCPLDESSFAFIFTCGSWTTQFGRFFFGVARDSSYGGTRVTTCFSLLCVSSGFIGIALSGHHSFLLATSMVFLGLGSGSQICLQPSASLFASHVQGLLISTLSGAFQLSGLVFVFLTIHGSPRPMSFGLFAGFLFCLTFIAAVILPSQCFIAASRQDNLHVEEHSDRQTGDLNTSNWTKGHLVEDKVDTHQDVKSSVMLNTNNEIQNHDENDIPSRLVSEGKNNVENMNNQNSSSINPNVEMDQNILEVKSASEKNVGTILKSSEYIFLLIWFSLALIPMQYYIGSLGYQMDKRGFGDTGPALFAILYAASAGFSPFLGSLADLMGLGISQGIATVLVACSLFILATTTTSFEIHAVGMGLYGVGRMMVFGTYFTNIGKRFGYKYYGTLSGVGLMTSGLISLFQYPLISKVSDGNDSLIDICNGVLLVALLPYCLWLTMYERR